MNFRENIKNAKRIVIKFGTNALTDESGDLAIKRIDSLVQTIAELAKKEKEIIIVTSGAVGMGSKKLGLDSKPTLVSMKQACAAIGQAELMSVYENAFNKYSIITAQILLTEDDFSVRRKYLSLRSTLNHLLELKVIPIINENDTVSTNELESYKSDGISVCFGDNDKLSALVMSKLDADLLIIMSDIDGLFDGNPRENNTVKVIPIIKELSPDILKLGFEASKQGRGGMKTKLEAAKIAVHSGGMAIIANGKKEDTLYKIFKGDEIGTVFLPVEHLSSRKRWIAYATTIFGTIKINSGAAKALLKNNASLLSAGMIEIKGRFKHGDVIGIIDEKGHEIARGIVNFSSAECKKITGKHSDEIEKILGYSNYDTVVSRDNIVIL